MDWVGAILDGVRDMECPNCGARLSSCGMRAITAEPGALVVRLACGVCGESSDATVRREGTELAAPITEDEVLDAHEFLRRWHGPLADLLFATQTVA
jgi:hypothetical protein